MIDSHCHLTDERLLSQLEEVLARAAAAGVRRMITVGTDLADAAAAVALCRGRENLRCAVGVHPNYCQEAELTDLPRLRELQSDPAVVALGEMGLDYHHTFADRARQARFFEHQLALAAELGRPVIIHCRDAIDDALAVLRDHPTVPAVFHCFTGSVAEAERILGAGYLLGYTGAATFKKADELRESIRRTPHHQLLIETDAPYLTPEPLRKQKTNEPALVRYVVDTIANMWGMTTDEIDAITSANTARFFRWPL
jgi:TatD DNase family protein